MKKYLFLLLLGFFFFAPKAHAAITLDTFATSSKTLGIGSFFITKAITTGGSNEILIVHTSFGAGGTITATTIVDGTNVPTAQEYAVGKSGGGSNQQFSWYVTGLSSGAHNVTTSFSGTNGVAVTMGLNSYDGVASVTPIDVSSTNPSAGAVTTTTVSLTTTGTNELIDEFLSSNTQINSNSGVGQTNLYFNILNSGNGRMASSNIIATSTATYTLGWVLNASSNQWVESAIALNPFIAPSAGATNANSNNMFFDLFNVAASIFKVIGSNFTVK